MKKNILALILLIGCFEAEEAKDTQDNLSDAVATEFLCHPGEVCSHDFDVEGKEKFAVSARYFDEEEQLKCLDVETNEDFTIEVSNNVLYISVENTSDELYYVFVHWVYEEPDECWFEPQGAI